MRSKSPEERGRQKVVRAPTYRIENEYNPEAMAQYFQVAVDVLKVSNLFWVNPQSSNLYVVIVIGKVKYKMNIGRDMNRAFNRESFIFDLQVSLHVLQHTNLWLAVMEPRCRGSRLLGESSMSLGEIWSQPNHQVFHKWVQLSPAGFLKVNVRIILRGELHIAPVILNVEKLKNENLLSTGSERQIANYVITIYGAFGLQSGDDRQTDKRYSKPPSTFVRVSFCGQMAKTAIHPLNNNPMYCEQISIAEMFPSTSQIINFDVFSKESCFNRILGRTNLCLGDISHDGENGFLPTFGPSLLHIYTSSTPSTNGTNIDGPFHRGALLVACNVIVPWYQKNLKSITVEPVAPIRLENLWSFEDFCVYCPIFEVSMLNSRITGQSCGVAITVGEMVHDNKSDEEFIKMMNKIQTRKLHYTGSLDVVQTQSDYGYLDFNTAFPVLQLAARLPDYRYKMYRNNMIRAVVYKLEEVLDDVDSRLKTYDYSSPMVLMKELMTVLEDTTTAIVKFLDAVHFCNSIDNKGEDISKQCNTELEQKQLKVQKEEIVSIFRITDKSNFILRKDSNYDMRSVNEVASSKEISIGSRKAVKQLLADIRIISQELKDHTYDSLQGWPGIVVWLLSGGSRVGFCKISPTDVIYSMEPEQCGKDCGILQTVYIKPLHCPKHTNFTSDCYCIAGKVELLAWMGLYRHKPAFETCLPGLQLKMRNYDMCIKSTVMMVECKAFIYKAKLKNECIGLNPIQTYLRIYVFNTFKETRVQCKTLTPVWNQVLKIQRMVFMTPERLTNSPAIVLVEVYNTELSGKSELIGRFEVKPTVIQEQDIESAPKLKWYDLSRGLDSTGQVLMSAQLMQIPEKLLKNIIYSPVEESFTADLNILDVTDDYVPLPKYLLPVSTLYKVDVYWWGFRDVDITRKLGAVIEIEDFSIKSDIIFNKQSNSNFPNGRISEIFEAPLSEAYCPMLNIRLFDSSTFGRTQYLGTNIVKNPNKYILRWLEKTDREASLKRASVISSQFMQVNQTLFIKKSSVVKENNVIDNNCASTRKLVSMTRSKYSKWKDLFWQKEPDEEEYTLLPIFSTKNRNKLDPVTAEPKRKDWWLKYSQSQTLFDSELENQPEFSKFKDWCRTLKLYNGKKTGIRETDRRLYCGLLKAGLAIYRWPPSDNKTAVTFSGIELNRGFFDDHPNNDPAKFLIRVYIVKGINLKTKEFVRKTSPYVVLSCGNKQLGNRNSYLPSKLNPIFGKMYEFRCNLPEDYLLTISMYDYDVCSLDELIGSTKIDLEDRIYTKHRARIGLPFEYSLNDLLKWRDCTKPSVILEELCLRNHISPPIFIDSTSLILNGIEYKDNDKGESFTSSLERKENLCLSILHKWHTLPLCGYRLVPDHIETRTLYNPDRPEIERGKIQMWVDIFPLDTGVYIPPPIDIALKKTEDYELRVTIYSIRELLVGSDNLKGQFSDIFLRAWLGFKDYSQNTDFDCECIKGEANFNWRMIFQFQYQPATQEIFYKENLVFTEYEESIRPILNIQLMRNGGSISNDCLGSLALNLNEMPRGVKRVDECTFDKFKTSTKINLFSMKSIRAWWPLIAHDRNYEKTTIVGKIDLELNILPQDVATLMPVGIGREPPFPLTKPKS
ncbi:otoferlin-like [Vanessa cardui]|uniref:otoferlin-like n=1 Tax=Vanessa cardui TaxID=171605 RepID=UPI001F13C8EB|nr:otoferlin-like [Vanessa cardui]